MSTFNFETITASQALGITDADHLIISSGPAFAATVLYGAGDGITLQLGAESVDFGAGLAALSQAGGITFTDGTVLYVGDAGANTKDFGIFSTVSGAFFGGAGNDTVTVGDGHFLVQMNAGDDEVMTGGSSEDTIYGGQGNDTISLGSGPGTLTGHNFAQGNLGDDGLFGSVGPDTLLGGKGNDTISGGGGAADFLNGNLGDDVINGQGQLFGEDGNDTITTGTAGPSTVSGGAGDDQIFAAGGGDLLEGGAGNDSLASRTQGSGSGDNTLSGGDGADTIQGAGGHDVVFGGAGGDYFTVGLGDSNLQTGQLERIMDWSPQDHIVPFDIGVPPSKFFEVTEPDYATALDLAQNSTGNGIIAVQVGADVIVFAEPAGSTNSAVADAVMLVGRTLADISASNFTLLPV